MLKPILNKIEKDEMTFSEPEFLKEIEAVFKHLTPGDKALMLRTNKNNKVVPARSTSVNTKKEVYKSLTFPIK